MKALIVEDFGYEALLLESLCASAGAQTKIASTMQDARRFISGPDSFDIIFLDLGLTDSSPKESVEAVPDLKKYARVVIVTGYDNPELRESAKEADGFLSKNDPDYADRVMAQLKRL
jgi:CheY-like chemotaxis protein